MKSNRNNKIKRTLKELKRNIKTIRNGQKENNNNT